MIPQIILIFLLIFLIYILSRFHPVETHEITEGLYAVSCGFVNFYALETTAGIVLFDTGINPYLAKFGLRKMGISRDDVKCIFLTHTDYDHAGGRSAFPNVRCYLSEAEEQMVSGETARRFIIHNRLKRPYITMKDKESIVIGDKTIKMISTPGHTPGSAVYSVDDHIVVCGDLLRMSSRDSYLPFLRFVNMNHSQCIESIETVRKMLDDAEYVLTGHSGVLVRMHKYI